MVVTGGNAAALRVRTGRNLLMVMELEQLGLNVARSAHRRRASLYVLARASELNDAQIWNAVKVAHEE